MTPTPLQRLSEIVEAGTQGIWAADKRRSVVRSSDYAGYLAVVHSGAEDAVLIAVAVRTARFLCSPEAVEVLRPTLELWADLQATDCSLDLDGLATALLNTIAEQALKEPSHG